MTRTCDLQVRNLTLYPTELWARKLGGTPGAGPQGSKLAERVGFEPTVPFRGTRALQARTFNHSVISP